MPTQTHGRAPRAIVDDDGSKDPGASGSDGRPQTWCSSAHTEESIEHQSKGSSSLGSPQGALKDPAQETCSEFLSVLINVITATPNMVKDRPLGTLFGARTGGHAGRESGKRNGCVESAGGAGPKTMRSSALHTHRGGHQFQRLLFALPNTTGTKIQ